MYTYIEDNDFFYDFRVPMKIIVQIQFFVFLSCSSNNKVLNKKVSVGTNDNQQYLIILPTLFSSYIFQTAQADLFLYTACKPCVFPAPTPLHPNIFAIHFDFSANSIGYINRQTPNL